MASTVNSKKESKSTFPANTDSSVAPTATRNSVSTVLRPAALHLIYIGILVATVAIASWVRDLWTDVAGVHGMLEGFGEI